MGLLTGISDFFGLDIGTTAVRVVQLRSSNKQRALMRYGQAPVDIKASRSDSPADLQRLTDTVLNLVRETGVSTKNVAVGLASDRTFATVIDVPRVAPAELKKTIQYQAESSIPQPLSEVKMDWALIGDSPKDEDKVEVLISTVPNEYAENRLNALEEVGFNVIALEPDPLALVRSVVAPQASSAQMVLDIGDHSSDLTIVFAGMPRLVRTVPTGGSSFVKAAVQNLNVDEKQAKQLVYKFGLSPDKLEGQVQKALSNTVDSIVSEIEKSIKFFKTRYKSDLEKIIVTGGASTLPAFPLHIANKLGLPVEIGNSWGNVSYPNNKHNDLAAISSQFGVAVGLALRQE